MTTATKTPMPMMIRGFCAWSGSGDFFFFLGGGFTLTGSFTAAGSSTCGVGDAARCAPVVIGRRREQSTAEGTATLAETKVGLADGVHYVGATRPQMLANTRAARVPKYAAYNSLEAFVIHRPPSVKVREAGPPGQRDVILHGFARGRFNQLRSETLCGWSRCLAIAVIARPDGSDGNTR